MKAYGTIIFATALFVSLSLTVAAQSTTTGAIGGTVSDPNRAVVIGATVSVRDVATNRESIATTNDEGRFRVPELQPGAYTMKISVEHFNPFVVENISVEVGRVITVDASLRLRPEDFGTVTISNTSVINTTQPDFSANINQTSLNELPINGRRWSNFALGTPTAVPDGGFGLVSFRGVNGLLNNNTIDGGLPGFSARIAKWRAHSSTDLLFRPTSLPFRGVHSRRAHLAIRRVASAVA